MNCKICASNSPEFFHDKRTFYLCPFCSLIFTDETLIGEEADQHYKQQWDNQDEQFWVDRAEDLLALILRHKGTPKRILDFGSGSGKLSDQFKNRGFDITPLDPMTTGYLKDQHYTEQFDVIISIEVIEHITDLWQEFTELDKVLSDDGIMIFSTLLTNTFIELPLEGARQHFATWEYKDDPTHVSFFNDKAIAVLSKIAGYTSWSYGNNLFVIKRIQPDTLAGNDS